MPTLAAAWAVTLGVAGEWSTAAAWDMAFDRV